MEWRAMRRKDLIMDEAESIEFLKENSDGHLGTKNPDGSPYITPINYAYEDGKFILHCAMQGQKVENMKANDKVCFEVSKRYDLIRSGKPCSAWETFYKSVICFGKAVFVEDIEEKGRLLTIFTKWFTGEEREFTLSPEAVKRTCVIVIEVEHMTGKKNWGAK